MNRTLINKLTRRGFGHGLAVLACLAALLTTLTAAEPAKKTATAPAKETAEQTRPNVVLILVDDLGYGDLSCHGNPVLKTPNMDRLWAESVRFTDFHVSSICAPTRAALMTGRYCRQVGVHGGDQTKEHLAEDAVTMADIFRANGYATGIFGKWHLGDRYPLRPMDRGFDESVVFLGGAVTTITDYWGNHYFDDTYQHNGKPQKYDGYCTDVWFEQAMAFIEKSKGRPFFCYLPTNVVHGPWPVPPQYNPASPLEELSVILANLDENLARLRRRLDELGIAKDTILIFMTDNGTAGGAAVSSFNAGMRGIKGSWYDGGHRVPFFIHHPAGGLVGGRDVEKLAANVDVLPTLVDLCGLSRQGGMPVFDGESLKPTLTLTDSGKKDRLLVESFFGTVMTERWRLVQQKELYDIQADPGQTHDVASEYPEVVARLNQALDACRAGEDQRPHYIVIGSDQQNPVTLTVKDFVKGFFWQSLIAASVSQHPGPMNVWNVHVKKAGRYALALRRWPRESGGAINGVLPKEKWAYGMKQCEALDAVEAWLRVGSAEHRLPVDGAMEEAEFVVELDAGPVVLEAWFVDRKQMKRSAYYLYAHRLSF